MVMVVVMSATHGIAVRAAKPAAARLMLWVRRVIPASRSIRRTQP